MRLGDARPADPDDLFPLDGRLRVYDTRHGRTSDGVLSFERFATRRERLSDGKDYIVVETIAAATRTTGARRSVSLEWLRREPEGVTCGRRVEGPLACDLEPPQLVVKLPLAVGDSWEWHGTAGGRLAHLRSVVLPRERAPLGPESGSDAWRIDSVSRSDGDPADEIRRTLWLQPGVGLVEERSSLAVDGRHLALDAFLVKVLD